MKRRHRQERSARLLTVRVQRRLLGLRRHGLRQRLEERRDVLARTLALKAAVQHGVVALRLDEVLAFELGRDGQLHAHELDAVLRLLLRARGRGAAWVCPR